jgi:hypothetical protein
MDLWKAYKTERSISEIRTGLGSHRKAKHAISPGIRELRFYISKAREINNQFPAKHIAIIGDKVVASGKSPMTVWKRAKKLYPQRKPVLAFVPTDDTGCYSSKREMKLSDFTGAWKMTDSEMREISKSLRRIRSTSPKLSDIAGSKTISKKDWQRAQRVLRSAGASTTSLK